MEVTELGMIIEVKPDHANASTPIDVTVLGIIVFWHPEIKVFVAVSMMALLLSRESYTVFPSSTVMVSKLVQPAKGLMPIDVTELGRVIVVKFTHPSKAPSPMEVNPVKYCSSLKLVISVLFWNTLLKSVTAAASSKLSSPSPSVSQLATQICFTLASAKKMLVSI